MATHSSILAWRISCTEKPGRLQDLATKPPSPITTWFLTLWITEINSGCFSGLNNIVVFWGSSTSLSILIISFAGAVVVRSVKMMGECLPETERRQGCCPVGSYGLLQETPQPRHLNERSPF